MRTVSNCDIRYDPLCANLVTRSDCQRGFIGCGLLIVFLRRLYCHLRLADKRTHLRTATNAFSVSCQAGNERGMRDSAFSTGRTQLFIDEKIYFPGAHIPTSTGLRGGRICRSYFNAVLMRRTCQPVVSEGIRTGLQSPPSLDNQIRIEYTIVWDPGTPM